VHVIYNALPIVFVTKKRKKSGYKTSILSQECSRSFLLNVLVFNVNVRLRACLETQYASNCLIDLVMSTGSSDLIRAI